MPPVRLGRQRPDSGPGRAQDRQRPGRARRRGRPAAAGRAGTAGAFRSSDVLARLGGDEFAVLAVESDAGGAGRERDRLQARFDRAGVPASVGVAAREGAGGLTGTWQRADGDMYRVKNSRRPAPAS